jgi:Flp pilus assembly protein TadD
MGKNRSALIALLAEPDRLYKTTMRYLICRYSHLPVSFLLIVLLLGFGVLSVCQADDIEKAIESLRRATEIDPDDASAHHDLGYALFLLGETDEAIESLRRATQLDPDFAGAHSNLGAALAKLGKVDEAIEPFRRASEIDPDNAEAHSNLGAALAKLGKVDEAIESFRRATEIDPKNLVAIANLANAHAKLEQVDRCGIWIARWSLANGLTAEAPRMKQLRATLRQLKVEVPAEQPTDQEIHAYYEANKESFSAAVHLRSLSLPKDTNTLESANELRDKLVAGGDFAAAAKHSDDLAAEDGGDQGWVKRGDLRQDLIDAAFALKAGEISAVIEDDTHYRILNTVEHREGTPLPLSEVRGRIVTKLIEEAQTKRIKGWIEQARKEHAEAMKGA